MCYFESDRGVFVCCSFGRVLSYYENGNSQNSELRPIGTSFEGDGSLDLLGESLSLSFDGNVLAIGERRKFRVYQFNDSGWELLGEALGESSSGDSNFVLLSSDGLLLAIGTTEINSSAVTSNIKVYEYTQSNANGQWNAYTTGEVLNSQNRISSMSLSADGTTLGCIHGKVMEIYQYEAPIENELEGNWVRIGIIEFESPGDVSSLSLALSGDGRRLVVGTVQGNSLDQI